MKKHKNLPRFFEEFWKANTMEYREIPPKVIRKAELDEIVPNKKYWKQSHTRPNDYYECTFPSIANWSTIVEMSKRIYVED